ncbi:hypothetical protein [Mesorhizobium humile]|uniref:HTH marR-type domain-containing protein n=1 Tax=Mesorhizobium humile TaxID=3072313 RepID=A0ABU4Y9K3_9HYPH|nr:MULTISPECIES: hypothetical protein [unclassified Mesorhizobium]MDX8458188.1 hypothetical protein [Mesorhizobium sp. VK2D]MDX8483601.1 hypothetical protein [Mesorhizobium sp. VK2B]
MRSFNPDQQMRLLRLSGAIATLPGLKLELLASLLTIAAEPGLSVNELADKTATPQASASRYVSVLTGRYHGDTSEPAVPLVSQEIRADDPRRRALFLTPEGYEAVLSIIEAVEPISNAKGETR